jgi:hypothetical protein
MSGGPVTAPGASAEPRGSLADSTIRTPRNRRIPTESTI